MNIPIAIFPNSGHHYFFEPLDAQDKSLSQNQPGLKPLCEKDFMPWESVPDHAWIRWRLGKRLEVPGLWVAVESNLGKSGRGWIFEPETKLGLQEVATAEQQAKMPAPYAHTEETDLPENLRKELNFRVSGKGTEGFDVTLKVQWLTPIADTINVDLVVDFGNTRTIALALEERRLADNSLSSACRPIRLFNRGENVSTTHKDENDGAIFDSWFVLQDPVFSAFEPKARILSNGLFRPMVELLMPAPKNFWEKMTSKAEKPPKATVKRVPQTFVEISPAVLGHQAGELLALYSNLGNGGTCFLSSPKRYLTDVDPVGSLAVVGAGDWTMNLNRQLPDQAKLYSPEAPAPLAGAMLRFLDEDGTDWSLGDDGKGTPPNERLDPVARPFPNPNSPRFPRADAMTWCALTLIETAYRQINSTGWRQELGFDRVPRKLRSIQVTFPSGWSGNLLQAYRAKWQKAIDIFTLTHLPNRILTGTGEGTRPRLSFEVDEAVASQMPYVFGEIERFSGDGRNWLSLVGRGQGQEATARILNIDIGGGTTDIAIVKYENKSPGPGANLLTELLFRESSTMAGDLLVKRVIESVLLPQIASIFDSNKDQREKFKAFMASTKTKNQNNWVRITRQVFIPIVRWWLSCLTKRQYRSESPANMLNQGIPIRPEILGIPNTLGYEESFNKLCHGAGFPETLLAWEQPLHYDEDRLKQTIRETFTPVFKSVTKLVEAFDCDLVLVSGKPSELGELQDLLRKYIPLAPQRIIFSRGAFVGYWYPLSNDGVIHDAKSVTVAGAALYQAIKNGMCEGWSIERKVSPHFFRRNYWGVMPSGAALNFGRLLLDVSEDQKSVQLMIRDRIGRTSMRPPSRPEPMYRLLWRNRKKLSKIQAVAQPTLTVTLQRSRVRGDHPYPDTEILQLAEVRGEYEGKPVGLGDVELQLCAMDADEYWIDAARFNIEGK
jgi:hypothetical protein